MCGRLGGQNFHLGYLQHIFSSYTLRSQNIESSILCWNGILFWMHRLCTTTQVQSGGSDIIRSGINPEQICIHISTTEGHSILHRRHSLQTNLPAACSRPHRQEESIRKGGSSPVAMDTTGVGLTPEAVLSARWDIYFHSLIPSYTVACWYTYIYTIYNSFWWNILSLNLNLILCALYNSTMSVFPNNVSMPYMNALPILGVSKDELKYWLHVNCMHFHLQGSVISFISWQITEIRGKASGPGASIIA